MKLSDFKSFLNQLEVLNFKLPSGGILPAYFHITEIGLLNKKFIDCGGTFREENMISFQLWHADDIDHRLSPQKLLRIISLAENKLGLNDLEIEAEYQTDTFGKYAIGYDGEHFLLLPKFTNCLAQDNCGIPEHKTRVNLNELVVKNSCCTPESSCC